MDKAKLFCSLLFMMTAFQVIPGQPLFTESAQLGEVSVWSISLEDLDGDGDPDACIDGNIWINDSKGNFTASGRSIGGGGAVDFGDLNGDEFTDAVCDSNILLNDGNWNFVKQPQTFGNNVKGAWLLDLDNDNDLDAVAYTDNSDMIWYNDGSGTFTRSSFSPGGWGQCKYSVCDINKDGFTDIIVGIPHTPPPAMNSSINDKIWLGSAGNIFTEKSLTSSNFETRSVLPADFDADGDIDLFMGKGNVISSAMNWSKILFNDGSGNFTDSGQKINSGYNSSEARLADLDNDGDHDIFIANGMPLDSGQPNTVWLNDGTGNFKDSGLRLGNSNSMALALSDIDGDTDIDALVGNVDIKTWKGTTNVYVNTTKSPNISYFGQTPPASTPEVFAPGIISGYVHGRIAISPAGDEFYWVVNPSTERIVYSRLENGKWTEPVLTDFVKDFLTGNNGGVSLSPDGNKLFFYSDRTGGVGKLDSWYVERTDSGWSEPVNAGTLYNSSGNDQVPLFSNKGNAYRFGFTDKDESKLFKYSDGVFSDPTLMEVLPDYHPWWSLFISPEEDYLIFAAGMNDPDLFIRFRTNADMWGNPINIGNLINTKEWERFPVVSPDGKYLFFTRGGSAINKLYWVSTSFIDSLKTTATEIERNSERGMPNSIKLNQNYPNPFNPSTQISYEISEAGMVRIKVFNALGQEIRTLEEAFRNAGSYTVRWDGTNNSNVRMSSGIYFCRMEASGANSLMKMVLAK